MENKRMKIIVLLFIKSFFLNILMADEKKIDVSEIDKLLEKSELVRRKKLEDLETLVKKTYLKKDVAEEGFSLAKRLCETPAWIHDINNEKLKESFGDNRIFKIEESFFAIAIGNINQQNVKKELPTKLPNITSKLGSQWFLIVKLDKNGQKASNTCYLSYSTIIEMKNN